MAKTDRPPRDEGARATPETDELFALAYESLYALAANYLRGERVGHTLQPTALINEAYVQLARQVRARWRDREHFLAVSAGVLRRVLVDYARKRQAAKRGGAAKRIDLEEVDGPGAGTATDVLELNDALERLSSVDARAARLVEMRYFAGLSVADAARALGTSKRTAEGDWQWARAWLHKYLSDG